MELHKSSIIYGNPPVLSDGPDKYFADAKQFVLLNYKDEFDRISNMKFEELTDHKFFHEYVWTVHTTGFSAKAVSKFFPRLMEAYNNYVWLSTNDFELAFDRIRKVCNNKQKAKAVHGTAKLMVDGIIELGWERFRLERLSTPILLQKFPYVGKITCHHIARNIGLLDSVKPDLHLVRMAKYWGFQDCKSMCESIQKMDAITSGTELKLGIIDLVLWYSSSHYGSLNIRQEGDR